MLVALGAAQAVARGDAPACPEGESWHAAMGMCMPAPAAAGAGLEASGHGAVFGVYTAAQGPRGAHQFAAPNWFMVDLLRPLDDGDSLGLEAMATAELWTFPGHGYAELLQAGEERSDGSVYRDAQHPHSSPLMGLTLRYTHELGEARSLALSFAPRGASTDGPDAFMHRASARDDPDAPLGHHVGQDVGHISSTVFAAKLDFGAVALEASAFNGAEPRPTVVDLPLGTPDSGALRLSYAVRPGHRIAAWYAHVRQEDELYPGARHAARTGAALADHWTLARGTLDHSLIVGGIARRPVGTTLRSALDEGTWSIGAHDLWWRLEHLERLPAELAIPVASPARAFEARWVSAATVGYTHWLGQAGAVRAGIGASITLDALPGEWAAAYGSRTTLTTRLVVQARLALPRRGS